jgi:hypothetical protein
MTGMPCRVLFAALAFACSKPAVDASSRLEPARLTGAAGSSAGPSAEPAAGPRAEPAAASAASGPCGLSSPVFCETFESPHPGGRAGDLDERVWSLARWGHQSRQFFVRIPASAPAKIVFPPVFCGKPFSGLLMPRDVAICEGAGVDGTRSRQLNEVFDDQGDFAFNSLRIRQPFDFKGRSGTIVFDVDAKINPFNAGHGWWIELFLTEDPAPMPYHEAPGVLSYPRNGLGFAFQGFNSCPKSATLWNNALNRVFVTRNHQIIHDYGEGDFEYERWDARCFRTQDLKLNRFKFLISRHEAEIWVTDYDRPAELRRIARVKNLDLSFTRGYVHLQHAQYNAHKDGGVSAAQTYRWDNVGFDGPRLPSPRAYAVADNTEVDIDGAGGHMYGYYLTDRSWAVTKLPDVVISGSKRAVLTFTIHTTEHARTLEYRFNGRGVHTFTIPTFGIPGGVRGFAIDVPLEELVEGANQLELRMAAPQRDRHEVIGNIELSLETSP